MNKTDKTPDLMEVTFQLETQRILKQKVKVLVLSVLVCPGCHEKVAQ